MPGTVRTKNRDGDYSWTEYRRLILMELESLNESKESLTETVHKLEIHVNTLQTKMAFIGIAGGFVSSLILAALKYYFFK